MSARHPVYKAEVGDHVLTTNSLREMLDGADAAGMDEVVINDFLGPRFHARKGPSGWRFQPAATADLTAAVHDALTGTHGCFHPLYQRPQCELVAAMLAEKGVR